MCLPCAVNVGSNNSIGGTELSSHVRVKGANVKADVGVIEIASEGSSSSPMGVEGFSPERNAYAFMERRKM